jgi:SprB repeat
MDLKNSKMKQKYNLKTIWIICSLIGLTSSLFGQDVVVTTTSTCLNVSNGEISLQFDASLLNTYSLPFTGEWENITTGDYEAITIVSLNHTISNLEAGDYELTIVLNDHCEIFLETTINSLATPTIASITPTCFCTGGYGALNVQTTGGSGNYGYAWSGTGLSNPNIQNPTVNATGNFTVTVTDSQTGCETTGQTTVANCNVNLPSIVKVTPDCNSAGTSTISIQLPPGYGLPDFVFKWIKIGTGVVETDHSMNGFASLVGASPGEYCLSLFTLNGCHEQFCGINVVAMPSPTIVPTAIPPTNASNGAISLNVTGAPGPFTYLWNTGQITADISGLAIGNYCVTVTDVTSKCTSIKCVKLLDCVGLKQAIVPIQATVTAMTGNGGNGAINITNVQDQFPEYHFNFSWNNGATTEDIKNLASGKYNVTITTNDCPGLIMTGQWEICSFSLKFSNILIPNNCNTTTIKVTPEPAPSGSNPYTYKWNTGATTQSIIANFGSTYCVTVTMSNTTCSASACTKPALPTLGVNLISFKNATNGNSNGSITVVGTGGVDIIPPPSYKYKWSNGKVTPTIIGLAPGAYTVTVTDGCGSTVKLTHLIQCEFGQSDLQGTVTNVSCGANTTGAITLTQLPNVGIPNPVFNYSWSNGATTKNIENLSEGEYCVTLTELTTGCYMTKCFYVEKSGEANFTISFNMNSGCFPLNEGSITASPSPSSQGPYTYSWSTWDYWNPPQNLGNTATINNLPAGWYTVVVTNAIGCSTSNFAIMWPGQPSFSATPAQNPVGVCKGQLGSAVIQVNSGASSGPFTYTWVNYSVYPLTPVTTAANTRSGLQLGNWGVTVTNAHGCQAFTTFSVKESVVKFTSDVHLDCLLNSSIKLTPYTGAGSYPPFTYKWNNGSTAKDRLGIAGGTYCVTMTDAKGCTANECFTIPPPNELTVFTGANVIQTGCSPLCEGSIDVSVSQPSTYKWSNGATTQDIGNLCAGSYIVTISSATCVNSYNFAVGENGLRTCAPLYQGETDEYDGSYYYQFKFFRIFAKESDCFDSNPNGGDSDSGILVEKGNGVVTAGCWTGTITIAYPTGDPLVLRVIDAFPTYDKIVYVSGEYEWDVPSAQQYEITITHTGEGASAGDDCVYKLLMNFYGNGNFNDAVGLNDDYWFNIPEAFKDSYFGAWRCETCKEENHYFLNNNQSKCKDFGNWLFTFFDYKPTNYDIPCKGGGQLTKLDFDASGNAVLQTINVKPSSFIAELPGEQPFGSNVNTWCTQSGWCLFQQDPIYPNGNLDKPILATWANPTSCKQVVWDEPGQVNPRPCLENSCPPPLICVKGNCVMPCQGDGDCMFGECVNEVCVETNDCTPKCPEGYKCHQGDCYLDEEICGFKVSVNGGGGTSSYLFWHEGIPSGSTLTLKYKTFNIADEIWVNGVLLVPCVPTGNNPLSITFPTVGNSTLIVVNSCGGPSSKFSLEILCTGILQEGNALIDRSQTTKIDETVDMLVHPNPFSNSLGITLRNVVTPFVGTAELLDNFGRQINSREIDFEIGNNSLTFDNLDGLATGVYSVVVKKEGKVYAYRKVIKTE